jgi:LPXTG-motif cell wall-anchored protein
VGGAQATPRIPTQTGNQNVVGGAQTLPSTSSEKSDTTPLVGLGGLLLAIGALLLRKSARRTN